VTNDAALNFYGASMLLAAARGYRGCEELAASDWPLRRGDQIGCVLSRRWTSRTQHAAAAVDSTARPRRWPG